MLITGQDLSEKKFCHVKYLLTSYWKSCPSVILNNARRFDLSNGLKVYENINFYYCNLNLRIIN